MLCRRALAQRVVASRSLSTRTPTNAQELLDAATAAVSSNASFNPFTSRATPEDLDGPPVAGPEGYSPSRINPMGRTFVDQWSKGANIATHKQFRFDCHSTRNNTITTLSSLTPSVNPFKPPESKVIAWFSGGSSGFKKGQRAGYEAGYQCAVRVFKLLEELKQEHGDRTCVHLNLRGFGQGREALKTALMASEGDKIRSMIATVTDRTALKIGGTRSKKTRRL